MFTLMNYVICGHVLFPESRVLLIDMEWLLLRS